MGLLSRDNFRNGVFERDNHKCVVCGGDAVDAHHIIERRLFDDGGYYLDNGASLCEEHHLDAERTIIGAQELRDLIGIKNIILPKGYHRDTEYDKWGNIVLPNGTRMKGELFYDESVQKIIKGVLSLFTDYVKYPRTKHLPWSDGVQKDDDLLSSDEIFIDREVVVTEKMDGENASIYSDAYFHARSVNGNSHPSQNWIKSSLQRFAYNIPDKWRVCGENLYATHSIKYNGLSDYFLVFSIWDSTNKCLSWDETVEWCKLLDLKHVPVLYHGTYDRELIHTAYENLTHESEGYVVRTADSYAYPDFAKNIAKFVRANHITEQRHNWRSSWNSKDINNVVKDSP